jgi:hypothetical protein
MLGVRALVFSILVATGLAAALVVACGASPAPAASCIDNPWQCAAGQTCWPQGCNCPSGRQFACIASATGIPLGES